MKAYGGFVNSVNGANNCISHQKEWALIPSRDKLTTSVLLIEDSEDSMLLVQHALEQQGQQTFRLLWAKNLEDGVSQLFKGGIDLVLLDLGLPDSRGPFSYRWLRHSGIELPIIVLTGDDREKTKMALINDGAEEVLSKPHTSGQLLLQAIQRVLLQQQRSTGKSLPIDRIPVLQKILLIEDNEDAMILVRRNLSKCIENRFQLHWETNLAAALHRLGTEEFDTIILDLGLPDSSGVSGYLQIRAAAPVTPVLVLTGNSCIETEFATLACGAEDYLDKETTSGLALLRTIRAIRFQRLKRDYALTQQSESDCRSVAPTFWGM